MVQDELEIEGGREKFLNDSFLIKTKQFTQFLHWFEQCYNDKKFGLVVGDQGTGKTTAIQYSFSKFIEVSELTQDCCFNTCYVNCLPSCTSTVLRQLILLSLSSNLSCEDKLYNSRSKGWILIRDLQIRCLMIDNAHLMTDKALMDIIEFSKTTKITLILIGFIKLSKTLRKLNLLNYFGRRFQFENLEFEEVIQVVKSLNAFLELPETSELLSPEVVFTFCNLSQGNFNILIQCLSEVIYRSENGDMFQFDKVAFESMISSHYEKS